MSEPGAQPDEPPTPPRPLPERTRLRALLARAVLVLGLLGGGAYFSSEAPRAQPLLLAKAEQAFTHADVQLWSPTDPELAAGFSLDFSPATRGPLRHELKLPNGAYLARVTLTWADDIDSAARAPTMRPVPEADREPAVGASTPIEGGADPPTRKETSFERRVTLTGSELLLSPPKSP